MSIVSDKKGSLRFNTTKKLFDFFDAHRIRTGGRNTHRWREGELIEAAGDAHFHSHTMLLVGKHILKMGAFSYSLSPLNPWMKMGRYCSIAGSVKVMGPQHAVNFVTSSEITYNQHGFFADTFEEFKAENWKFYDHPQAKPLEIQNDVWIGQDVLLKNGIVIGNGAVVGAGAIVVKDVAPYEIVAGVPARRLRFRFNETTIEALLKLKWWEYAIPQLPDAGWNDPERFIPTMQDLIARGVAKPFHSDLGSVRDVLTALHL